MVDILSLQAHEAHLIDYVQVGSGTRTLTAFPGSMCAIGSIKRILCEAVWHVYN